jgi:hypothetical protein
MKRLQLTESDRIILGIPGNWHDKREIISLLTGAGERNYQIIGEILIETATNESCQIYFRDRYNSRKILEPNSFDGEDRFSWHQIVYLSDVHCNYKNCLKIAKFAKIFLDIGGLAVRVESAGIIRDRQTWLAKYNSSDVFDIYSLFVVLIEGEDKFYSSGMNHFGKADVSVEGTEETSLAIYVMNVFNYYRLTEFPLLKDGQTFQPDLESPMYQIRWTQSDKVLQNPYGCWHLSRI